ncbi:MAG TPA: nickel-binding protein [Nocardioidaceae bacterium]|nr:nickel-binding protein [Nocardioidaceae bacterium]
MAEYLVELYVAQGDHHLARQHAEQVEQAAAELTQEGRLVRCLRSIFVPEDETCFLLYEAPSAGAIEEAVRRAGLRHQHISAATSTLHTVGHAPTSPQPQGKATP